MDKRKLHQILVGLRQLRAGHLGIAFVVLLGLGVLLMRQNNLHMITLRNLVIQADEQNQNIPEALTNLRNYIAAHMNTGMGERGIYLEHSYQRVYEGAVQGAIQNGSEQYKQADKTCRGMYGETSSFQAYAQCVADKTANVAAGITLPSADLYRFNFVAPAWSPDVAGFTLLAAFLAGALLAGRFLLQAVVYALLRANR